MNKPFKYKDYNPYYFYGERPFSQWGCDKDQFIADGQAFNCCEQYMMYHKAMLFGDTDTAKRIMEATHPKDQKALGRLVSNFNPKLWDTHNMKIVTMGNIYKFSQNEHYKARLMQVFNDGNYFVEASPYDKIWGIGISVDDAKQGVKWKGDNLLGKALTSAALYFILHP